MKICGLLEIELDFAEENAIFISRPEIENSIFKQSGCLITLSPGTMLDACIVRV